MQNAVSFVCYSATNIVVLSLCCFFFLISVFVKGGKESVNGGLRCFNPMLLLPHTSTQYWYQMKCSFSACLGKIEVYVVKCDDEMFYFDVDCVLFVFVYSLCCMAAFRFITNEMRKH